jgi:3-hydroxymyristoyl/3-hydroxydecanoyl-(acyl carrier protein) dehydratase
MSTQPRFIDEAPAAGPLRILRVMPHRHPMLLVDNVEDGADADSAVAFKNISFNEPCFRDAHAACDADSIAYPLSLLMESFGQGAGLLLARRGFLDRAGSSCAVVFGQFEHVDIVADAFPGDRLRHEVRLDQAVGTLVVLSGRTKVGDRVIARYGSLKAFLVPTAAIAKGAAA